MSLPEYTWMELPLREDLTSTVTDSLFEGTSQQLKLVQPNNTIKNVAIFCYYLQLVIELRMSRI